MVRLFLGVLIATKRQHMTDDVAAELCVEMEQEEAEQLWETVEGIMRDKPYEVQGSFARQWDNTLPRHRKGLLQEIILRERK